MINVLLLASAALSLVLTSTVCEIPVLAAVFDFSPVSLELYAVAIGLGLCVIPVVEIVKIFQRMAGKR